MNLRDFFRDYIQRWEGGLSTDADDPGNWTGGQRGVGQLVGSNHGVTPAALAKHRGVAAGSITQSAMATLTLDEAIDIAIESYFKAPGFDRLPWNRVTASIVDMGWGAGPAQAVKLLQRLVGVPDDGKIGPKTIAAYASWLEEGPAKMWQGVRDSFYDRIIATDPVKQKYRNGWRNRSAYFAPGSDWWGRFV
jgi:lysozyme family protein